MIKLFLLGIVYLSTIECASADGSTPYTPTKLEWMVLVAQGQIQFFRDVEPVYGKNKLLEVGINVMPKAPNTLRISVSGLSIDSRKKRNEILQEAKSICNYSNQIAKDKAWSDWFKCEIFDAETDLPVKF